jgi:surface antigen
MHRHLSVITLGLAMLFCEEQLLVAQEQPGAVLCSPPLSCGAALGPQVLGVGPVYNSIEQGTTNDCDMTTTKPYGDRYQCVEFVSRFYSQALHVDTSTWSDGASAYWRSPAAKGLIAFPNGATPVKPALNDIMFFAPFGDDTAGHVAIVQSVTDSMVVLVEQNYRCSGTITLSLSQDPKSGAWTVGPRPSKQTVKGWLRLKTATASGPPTFASRFDILTTAGSPVGVAVADFDGDGRKDIAATIYNNGSGNQVVIFPNTSTPGSLSFALPVTLTTDQGPEGIVAVDLDGDGKPDLAVANASGGTVTIFRNVSTPGALAFTLAAQIFVPATPHRIAVADFDGDGKLDLIVTSNSAEEVTVLHNASSPGIITIDTQTSFTTQSFPNQLAVADIDGDGRPDILVPVSNSGNLEIYRNTSTPGSVSVAPAQFFATGAQPEGIAVGGLTGAGKVAVLVPAGGANTLGVFTNASTPGSLSLSRNDLPTGMGPNAVVIGDLENSGLPDAVVLNGADNTFTVFHNASTGTAISLTPLPAVATSLGPTSVAIADIDGDGTLDLVISNQLSGSISVFLNLGGQP